MEYIDRYRGELLEVFAEAEAEAGRFPDELGRLGRELIGACHPLKTGGKASGIAYLLPYWMDDITGLGAASAATWPSAASSRCSTTRSSTT